MRSRRVIALVIAGLLAIPGIPLLAAGTALGLADMRSRETGGYVAMTPSPLQSSTPAVVTPAMAVVVDPNTPQWGLDRLATDLRLTVSGKPGATVFVGVARTNEVDVYLAGVAHDEITARTGGPAYHRVPPISSTAASPSVPADQTFWAAQAVGAGTLSLDWKVTSGSWTVAVMNADGSPGVAAVVTPSVRSDALGPLALTLLATGLFLTVMTVLTLVLAFRRRPALSTPTDSGTSPPATPVLTPMTSR
jgi:hypothetical protein